MKTLFKFILLFSILISSFENSYSQVPTYTLQAKNFVLVNPARITFDIIFTHTNAITLEYSGGQYFFKIPQSLGNVGVGTGTNSGFQNDSLNGDAISDFPYDFRPRNPSVVSTIINGVPSYELRLASNPVHGAGNGLIIPEGIPLLVMRMKITSITPFNLSNFIFFFRDSCSDNPVSVTRTKINVHIGTAGTEITRCVGHSVDPTITNGSVICNIKLAIEGLYNSSTDKLLKKDTVSAYLRNVTSPYQIIDSAKAVIDSITFNCSFVSYFTHSGTPYYIVVKHRNSLETWSKQGGEILVIGNNSYDFTTSATQAYGNNLVLKGSKYCIYSGNVNYDMIIDSEDLAKVDNDLLNYSPGSFITNLNADNIVDIDDLAIADKNANQLILVEWPGLTSDMRKGLLKNKIFAGGTK